MSKKPLLFKSICDHFDIDPAQLPVLAQNDPSYERANPHLAIQEFAKMCVLLYSQGLTLKTKRCDEIIKKIDGVSAAFIRELLRKAAVFAAMDSQEDLIIRDKHSDE